MHQRFLATALRVVLMAGVAFSGLYASDAMANARVKKATAHYLKGSNFFSSGKYSKAVSSFRRAYGLLPRHPHFNCHRTRFLDYMGRSYERLRQPHRAMQSFYTAAYRVGCKTASVKGYSARRYRYLYGRWMCSISFNTTPPKARVYQITSKGDKLLSRTPYKKVFSPGKYSFKIRLYDHRTIYYKVDLRPGRHLKKNFKMVKGDDPVTRVEKVDIAPPVPIAKAGNTTNTAKKKVARTDPNKINLGTFSNPSGSKGLDPGGSNTNGGGDIADRVNTRKIVKAGPPVYKQVWFWAVIGSAAALAVVIPIVIPKDQKALVSQGKMF
jgi:hypothetical protein